MKKELLSPAGDFESLKAAVHAGCDAVYIGGKKFGARKFASNFDYEELSKSVEYCHLYNVKLYVTVNTMIYEEEMESVLDYIAYLYKINVDAIIVQDIGLIKEIRNLYPDMEIHASTQLHNNSVENCQLLEELGVKRIVLAREMSVKEVQSLDTKLEKEVFIHGAICISYSGQCLFSSIVLNRSGNRGECAGMCRLPYKLAGTNGKIKTEGDYLLSPRELCTIPEFTKLMESDITCFKIEGRMKSPAYVYFVTKIYRTLMDKYERKEEVKITEEEYEKLRVLYNRKFTTGNLFNSSIDDFMNIETPNHIGIPIGKVIDIKNGKLKILLEKDIHQGDGIRFTENKKGTIVNFLYNEKNLLIKEAKKNEVVLIDNKVNLEKKSEVLKTQDFLLMESLKNYPEKKIRIKMHLTAHEGLPLTLKVIEGTTIHQESSIILEKAKTSITTKEDIINHLNRLGNTPYDIEDLEIDMEEELFIPMKALNDLRRTVVEELTKKRLHRENRTISKKYVPKTIIDSKKNVQLCCLVRSEEQLLAAINHNLAKIYITDITLYEKYKNKYENLYYREERIFSSKKPKEKVLYTELSQLKNDALKVTTDYYLNVANTSFLEYLESKKIDCATLSIELTPTQIENLAKKNNANIDLEVVVYGRVELMVMKYCPLNYVLAPKNKTCTTCQICKDSYYLIDRNQENYPLLVKNKLTHIMSSQKQWIKEKDIKTIINSGISYIRIECFEETGNEVNNILEKYQQMLHN